jgi:hypothetical protein
MVAAAALLAGCQFSSEVSADVALTCTSDQECPSRSSCNLSLGQCVSLEADILQDGAVWPSASRPGLVVHASFTLTRTPAAEPNVTLVDHSGQRWPLRADGVRDGVFVYTTTLDPSTALGPASVIATFVDTSGHTLMGLPVGTTTVVTAPFLGDVVVHLVPSPDNPLVVSGRSDRLLGATVGTTVQVDVLSAGGSAPPEVTASGPGGHGAASFGVSSTIPGGTRLSWVVPSRLPPASDGRWDLSVRLPGEAGLVAERSLPAAFLVDTLAPLTPGQDLPGALAVERAPFGTLEHPGVPQWALRVRQPGDPLVFQVFAGPFLLASLDSAADGTLPATALPLDHDTLELSVRSLDFAGNTSPLIPVRDFEWVTLASQQPSAFTLKVADHRQDCVSESPTAYSLRTLVEGGWAQAAPGATSPISPSYLTFLYWDQVAQELVAFTQDPTYATANGALSVWRGSGWKARQVTSYLGGTLQSLTFDPDGAAPTIVAATTFSGAISGPQIRQAIRVGLVPASSCHAPAATWQRGQTLFGGEWGARLAYDSRRHRIVRFGGTNAALGGVANARTEVTSGLRTSLVDVNNTSTLTPSARAWHAQAYDPLHDLVVVFGGRTDSNLTLGDTWLFDGLNWRRGPNGPPARTDATLAWDPERQVLVLAGGRNGNTVLGDQWDFDGVAWTTRGAIPPRANAGLAWHPLEHRWVWAGGVRATSTGTTPAQDTWVSTADGGWAPVLPPVAGADAGAAPVALSLTGANILDPVQYAFDPRGQGFAFVGSGVYSNCDYSGCFSYPVAGAQLFSWTDAPAAGYQPLTPTGPTPPGRGAVALVFSPDLGLVMVGGRTTTSTFGDTWAFSDGGWKDLDASVPPRANALLAWDPGRARLVLHGGALLDGGALTDTFEYLDGGWQPISTLGPPTPVGASLSWVDSRGGLVLAAPNAPGLAVYRAGAWSSEPGPGPLGPGNQTVAPLVTRGETFVSSADPSSRAGRWLFERDAGWVVLANYPASTFFSQEPDTLVAPDPSAISAWRAADVRPSIVVTGSIPDLPTGAQVSSVTMRVLGGAHGLLDGGVIDGLRGTPFIEGAFTGTPGARSVLNRAPPDAPSVIEWNLLDPSLVARNLGQPPFWSVRLESVGSNGAARATLQLDDVETRWAVHLPDSSDGG